MPFEPPWEPWYPRLLDGLLAVAAAELDAQGRLRAANAGFRHLLPDPQAELLGLPVGWFFVQPRFETLSAGDHSGLFTVGDALGQTRSLRGCWRCVPGGFQWLAEHDIEDLERLSTALLEINEKYQLIQQNMSMVNWQLRRREAEVLALSHSDALTGVGNRRYLDTALQQQVAQALQTGAPLSVVMTDLDHFKAVNDTHGHPAGDAVLAAFGAQLRQNSRASDVVARFGGEEFLVLMPETPLASAADWAERMRALCERTTVAPLPAPITVSLGVATLHHSAASATEAIRQLIQDADAALYQAKRAGRNRVVVAAGAEG
jgi:two-component system, cell cycle response regulator